MCSSASVSPALADFADVHVDAAVKGRKLAAEHGIHQTLARDDSPSFPQQHFQQIKFDRREVDGWPSRRTLREAGSSSISPTRTISGVDGNRFVAASTAQDGSNPRYQFPGD